MGWNQDPQVLSPVGRSIGEQLEEGPPRQALDGFEPVYRDIVDYIIRCTPPHLGGKERRVMPYALHRRVGDAPADGAGDGA